MSIRHAEQLLELLRLRDAMSVDEARERWTAIASWDALLQALESEGATLWLHRRLHDRGIKPDAATGDELRKSAHKQLMFGLRVEEEASAVSAILRNAGMPFALIKGPARRIAAKLYPYADARATSDVDMLVPDAQARDAWNLLRANGYEEVPSQSPPDHFHLHGLWSSRKVGVELHMSTAPWIEPAEAWRRATEDADEVSWGGASFRIGNATELLWHGMSHSFVDGSLGFRLRTFLDGAVILASGRAIDWELIERRMNSGELRDWEEARVVSPHLQRRWIATAAALAGVPVPAPFNAAEPFPLARLLNWKAMSMRMNVGRAMRERMIEEGTRAEFGMPLTPSFGAESPFARGRRRIATTSARVGYLGWRVLAG